MSMWTKKKKTNRAERLRDYDREMLRSMFVSLFWVAIQERKRRGRFTLQELAKGLGVGKSIVSRWFSGQSPNWQSDTISDIANALDLDIEVKAIDRSTGAIITPSGVQDSTANQLMASSASGQTTAASSGAVLMVIETTVGEKSPGAVLENLQLDPEHEFVALITSLTMSPAIIKQDGKIEVWVAVGEDTLKLGTLKVIQAPQAPKQ